MLGTVIDVFIDPVTEKELEGKAKILRLLKVEKDFIFYYVEFVSDGRRVARKVKNKLYHEGGLLYEG